MQLKSASELQSHTLRLYGEMLAERAHWTGALVFTCGSGVAATGLAAAVSIAGGTTLMLDSDASTVKKVFRQGGVDFVVNTLDEALRVLKNEIRKKRPLGVALLAELQPVLAEMEERGVLPDLVVNFQDNLETPGFAEAPRLRAKEAQDDRLAAWLAERGWSETVLQAASVSALREIDSRILSVLPEEDMVRRNWVQRIGHYQRGSDGGERVVWLTESERGTLGLAGR